MDARNLLAFSESLTHSKAHCAKTNLSVAFF